MKSNRLNNLCKKIIVPKTKLKASAIKRISGKPISLDSIPTLASNMKAVH